MLVSLRPSVECTPFPPFLPPQRKKNKKLPGDGAACVGGGLGARWLCFLFVLVVLVVCVIRFLPKAACHGGDAGGDSWLKWLSTLLTVLRRSRILVDAIDLDRRYAHPAPVRWQSRERSMSKAWYGYPKFH